jgi:hypothetical protein
VDRREQGGVCGVTRTWPDRDGGEMTTVLRIGQAVHRHGQLPGSAGDLQVVQGGTAAQDEVAAVRVGRG